MQRGLLASHFSELTLDISPSRLQEALINPKKILIDAKLEHDIVKNYKLLQAAFMKKGINKVCPPPSPFPLHFAGPDPPARPGTCATRTLHLLHGDGFFHATAKARRTPPSTCP